MATSIDATLRRAISPGSVRAAGSLTEPRTYGVYRLPHGIKATRCYRFGNHPVRMQELEREFGVCKLEHLFRSREDAEAVARAFNASAA